MTSVGFNVVILDIDTLAIMLLVARFYLQSGGNISYRIKGMLIVIICRRN